MLSGSSHYELSNIVNGVTCAIRSLNTSNIYLLNLTTQTLVKSLRCCQRGDGYPDIIGLGFDSSKGVYKIVRLFYCRGQNSYFCKVISVGETDVGEWRFIGKIFWPILGNPPVFLNGILYWQSQLCQSGLTTFDVEEEKLGSMVTCSEPLPLLLQAYNLMELDGHLCITRCDKFTGNLEVRILKDHTK